MRFESQDDVIAIRLFGVPSIARDEAPLSLGVPPRALALLAYLATKPGEVIPREHLATLLWPDVVEADGRANLRRHVHLLTRALPPAGGPWLLVTSSTLAFNPRAPVWVDAVDFERASGAGRELERAVGLYAGEFMRGFDDDWVVERRLRLSQLQVDNLDQLLTRAIAERDTGGAIAHAQAMLRCDPWREDAVRHLIRLRRQAGDRAGALVEYERFAQRLRAEIDVDPMPETLAEYQNVLHDVPPRPAAAAPRGVARGGATAPFEMPFVGRQIELEALQTAFSRAARGYGRLVLIGGEAGAGKSRLLGELRAVAERAGALLVRGTTPIIEASPYQVVAETIGAAVAELEGAVIEPIWLAALAAIVPEIGRRYPALPRLPELDPERDRRRLFEAISIVLTRLAATRPLLVELEDLHWAGPATIALLEDLARNLAGHPVLVVATYREEELEHGHPLRHVRRRLLREGLVDRVSVGLLTQREVEAAIVPFVPDTGRAALARELYARTDGNPFFLGELIRDRLERVAAGGAADGDGTPPALHETIVARLGRLGESAHAVAAVAAIIGRAFDLELVRAIGGWRERELLDALDELIERGIVREAGAGGNDYAFAHHLIQASAYDQTAPAQRRRRHRRVALALEDLYPARLGELALEIAHHFEAGGEPEPAARYFARAAANALDLLANDDAVAFATRGLAQAQEPALLHRLLFAREEANRRRGERAAQRADLDALEADAAKLAEDDRFELARRRCALAHALGERKDEATLVDRLATIARRSGDPARKAIAALASGTLLASTNRYAQASAVLADGFALAAPVVPEVALQCALRLVRVAAVLSAHDDAERWLEQARRLVGHRSPGYALLLEANCAWLLSRSDPATIAQRAAELLDVAAATGDLLSQAIGSYYAGLAAAWRFEVEPARNALAEAERLFGYLDDKEYLVRTLIVRGNLAVLVGALPEALAAHGEAERLAATIDYEVMQAVAALNLTYDAMLAGEVVEAVRSGQRAVRLSAAVGAPRVMTLALANLAVAERRRGALDVALEHLQSALAQARADAADPATLASTLGELAETYRQAGRMVDARRAAEEMLAVFTEADVIRPQLMWWIAAQVYHDEPERAAEFLERAHRMVQAQAGSIPDQATRAAFTTLSYNREIISAFAAHPSDAFRTPSPAS